MRRFVFLAVILAIVASVTGCGREYFLFLDPAHPWARYVREVSPSDHSIAVIPGTLIRVHLDTDTRADCQWTLISDSPCRAVALADTVATPADPASDPPTHGFEVWSFRAVQPGHDDLLFGYLPASRPTRPLKTRHLSIIVQE